MIWSQLNFLSGFGHAEIELFNIMEIRITGESIYFIILFIIPIEAIKLIFLKPIKIT